MATLLSHREAKDDPNHPPELDITPSSGRKRDRYLTKQPTDDGSLRGTEASSEFAAADSARDPDQVQNWDQDSATDIQRWGIAGRIW